MTERSSEIAAATRELIVESGGALPTVRQIAARSFLSPAAIYVHFPNFDAIVQNVRLSTIAEFAETIRSAGATSLGGMVAPAAKWMVENQALLAACTSPSHSKGADVCVSNIEELLTECGMANVDNRVIMLGISLIAPVPALIADLGYTAREVELYLHSLAAPLSTVSAMPPIEVIHA